MTTECYSITTLNTLGTVRLLDGDDNFPFVEKDGMFFYYALTTGKAGKKVYKLVMESQKDLGERREE